MEDIHQGIQAGVTTFESGRSDTGCLALGTLFTLLNLSCDNNKIEIILLTSQSHEKNLITFCGWCIVGTQQMVGPTNDT